MGRALKTVRYGSGAPTSVVPQYKGELYFDIDTGKLYRAYGTSAGNWYEITDANSVPTKLSELSGSLDNVADGDTYVKSKVEYTSTEKEKLSGIEARATGDQTAAEILALLKDADGSGSGLDADTLDGNESSHFATASDLSAHIADTENPHSVTKTQVGLGNVDNVEQIPLSQKGVASGVATLDSDGKIPSSQLPAIAISEVFVVSSESEQLALNAQSGDAAVRSDLNKTYLHNGGTAGTMDDWTLLKTPTDAVLSVFGRTGAVTAESGDYSLDEISETSTYKRFTADEKSKLADIEEEADATDAENVKSAGAVMTSGNQSIAGVKTFSSFPVVPSSDPESDAQVVNKQYVDGKISGLASPDTYLRLAGTIPNFSRKYIAQNGLLENWLKHTGSGVISEDTSEPSFGFERAYSDEIISAGGSLAGKPIIMEFQLSTLLASQGSGFIGLAESEIDADSDISTNIAANCTAILAGIYAHYGEVNAVIGLGSSNSVSSDITVADEDVFNIIVIPGVGAAIYQNGTLIHSAGSAYVSSSISYHAAIAAYDNNMYVAETVCYLSMECFDVM